MIMRGMRLFSVGLVVLSAAMAHTQSKVVENADVAPAPAAPAPELPMRPAELPPNAPRVTCNGDQITISADNSTLDAILVLVKGCTGARIDIPQGASRVRSFEELGPGPVRQVLDKLLSGTEYNYVIQSSEANPLKVETVLVSMRTNDTDKPGAGGALPADIPLTPGRRAWQHMQKFDKPDPSTLNADGTAVEVDGTTPAVEAASPAQPVIAPTGDTPSAEASAAAAPSAPIAPPVVDANSNSDQTKAIQDRISSMQQMFNQRQQMIQKQAQSQNATPNN